MTQLMVKSGFLTFGDQRFHCATGKGGFSTAKREGDGCTPIGIYFLRECWYRLDRLPPPKTGLPLKVIRENDGWCDDPVSKDYNKPIKIISCHPRLVRGSQATCCAALDPRLRGDDKVGYSHERLWHDDHVYDLIVPLGYNDDPVVAGRGSAIFMHVAQDDYSPTEGCVALAFNDLLAILPHLTAQSRIEIRQ